MINSRQMEILIQLQFFDEFGKNKKLLNVYRRFKDIYGRKNIMKAKMDDFNIAPEDIVDAFEKETEKQYMNIDTGLILNRICEKIPNEIIPLDEQIAFELEIVGYLSATYDVEKTLCYITDIDTKYSPRVKLYSLKTGKEVECKINKTIFKNKPLEKGQIVKCDSFIQKYKQQRTENGWERTDIKEWWLNVYSVVDKLEI